MTHKIICQIATASQRYEIEIGYELLHAQSAYLQSLGSKFAIITDDNVAQLYGKQLQASLNASGLQSELFVFSSGEQSKTRATKEVLENQLFEKGFGRDSCVVALGGGVVTDVAGYLAATYCRGVPLVIMPTSLLGMVDASIGGKTGVNVPYGKNMLGCIYQPKKVVMDLNTLATLPKKEFSNGFAEMIKHALIADSHFFGELEKNASQFLGLTSPFFEQAIFKSCRIKNEIVEEDEKEIGKRHLLNFGHTIGHALESLSHYTLSHGEAVAIGILFESQLSLKLGFLDQTSFDRIKAILVAYGLPLQIPHQFSFSDIQKAVILDKKSLKGQARFVLLESIGSPVKNGSCYCLHVDEILIKNTLEWMYDDLCGH